MTREAGQVGGLEAVAFGFLVLVAGILVVASAWGVVDAETAARTAAREGARTFATDTTSDPSQAETDARAASLATLRGMGWTDPRIVVTLHGSFVRCGLVTEIVTITVPVLRLPWLRRSPGVLSATARDTERVDPYRSGVPGPTLC